MVFLEDSAACLFASFLEKDAMYLFIPLKRGWMRVVFLVQKKNTQTEPPPPENRKKGLPLPENNKYGFPLENTNKTKKIQ